MWIVKELLNAKNGGVVVLDVHTFETNEEVDKWKSENERYLIKRKIALVIERQ